MKIISATAICTLLVTPVFVVGGFIVLLADALAGFGAQGGESPGGRLPLSEFEKWANSKFEEIFEIVVKMVQIPVPGLDRANDWGIMFGGLFVNGIFWSVVLCLAWLLVLKVARRLMSWGSGVECNQTKP